MSEFPPPSEPSQEAVTTTAPGWYFDGTRQRWWDGTAWGPAATSTDDNTFATLAHLGSVFGGFILPLVLYVVSKDGRRPETRFHAREALNFQLTFLAIYFPAFAIYMFVVLARAGSGGDGSSAGFFLVLGLFMLFAFAASIAAIVLGVRGALRANKGERYRYPISIRILKEST